jgi:hypothetical protein
MVFGAYDAKIESLGGLNLGAGPSYLANPLQLLLKK